MRKKHITFNNHSSMENGRNKPYVNNNQNESIVGKLFAWIRSLVESQIERQASVVRKS